MQVWKHTIERGVCAVAQFQVLADNYSYLLIDERNSVAAAVDVADSERTLRAAKQLNVSVESVLTTHRHADHMQGNSDLVAQLRSDGVRCPISVFGGSTAVDQVTEVVGGDVNRFTVGELEVRVRATPCHTREHVVFVVDCERRSALFSGDTLFKAGAGRTFEGDGADLCNALATINECATRSDGGDALVFCGHEYSVANLRFAAHLEPSNARIADELARAIACRERGEPTVPSLLADELNYNPFLRLQSAELRNTLNIGDSASLHDAMAIVRAAKDCF
jgi:hydroxyacylglutathione hydrolase